MSDINQSVGEDEMIAEEIAIEEAKIEEIEKQLTVN